MNSTAPTLDEEPEWVRESMAGSGAHQEHDVLAVLTMHLYIEALVAYILTERFPDRAVELDRLSFAGKCGLARRENLITKRHARLLQQAGDVRNSFAHLPVKIRLTVDDEANLMGAFNDDERGGIQILADGLFSKFPVPGRLTRAILSVLMVELDEIRHHPMSDDDE